ncbi:hypothetical protein E1B28_004043 [Marasmius oreades]|uniref:AB hydrolase-1 domain-containing protein n=1 Tax=Marasmius oreades TaxID=181124 RepID=A0A9P8ABQ0_9AGAR|nr:uncharacterized protein E1B28_004043 [Marasmius oreades]KAG7096626.1 hypothetical protein E1B28_004043 [Marasmius oreades]
MSPSLPWIILILFQIVQVLAAQIQGTLHRRNYFYIGENYVSTVNESFISAHQIYVENLVPAKVTQALPILIIHGRGMTGTNFLNTPDGRTGWADFFLGEGFELYLIDQPSRGRSPWQNGIDGSRSSFDVFTVESRFTAPELFGLWPLAGRHTQWPGNGTAGDPIFDEFYASTVPALDSDAESEVKTKNATVQLLDRIGPVILLTHSQSGSFGWQIADARPNLVKTIIAVEPMGPPFMNAVFPPTSPARPFGLTETPLTFSPPVTSVSDIHPALFNSIPNVTCFEQAEPAKQLVNLAKVPVTVITSESSYHAMYDNCTVRFLQQAGVSVKHTNLPEIGIFGNGHMMFMEKNNLEIAEKVVKKWIKDIVG